MTSIPASRSARAMIFAPRSCPSSPGLATTTRIFRVAVSAMRGRGLYWRLRSGGSGILARGVGALACGLAALLIAGSGGKVMETTLQDDAVFLHRRAAQVRAAARQLAALGADRLRLTAGWSAIAPRARARRMPRGRFVGSNPGTY